MTIALQKKSLRTHRDDMLDLFEGEHPSNVNDVVMQSSLRCITINTETLNMFTEYLGERCIKKIVLTIGSLTLTLPSPFGLR